MYDEPANDQSIIRGEKHRLDTLRNKPLPSSSHLQNEANGKTSVVKINFIWMRKNKKTKNIFITMAWHLASLWNRGFRQLTNGLLTMTGKGAEKKLEKLEDDMKHMQRDGSVMGTLDTLISKNA